MELAEELTEGTDLQCDMDWLRRFKGFGFRGLGLGVWGVQGLTLTGLLLRGFRVQG